MTKWINGILIGGTALTSAAAGTFVGVNIAETRALLEVEEIDKTRIFEDLDYIKDKYGLDMERTYSNTLENFRVIIKEDTTTCYQDLIEENSWNDRNEIDFEVCILNNDHIETELLEVLSELNHEIEFNNVNYLRSNHKGWGGSWYNINTNFLKEIKDNEKNIDLNEYIVCFETDSDC